MLHDDELARRSRDGDPHALTALYGRYAGILLGYLERLLPDRDEAEDVLQETFLRLFEGRGRFEGQGRFRSWIFTIATRLAHDRLRTRKRRGVLTETYPLDLRPSGCGHQPDQSIRSRELHDAVDAALADLPESYAATFHLRIREEMSYPEIAEITGEPEGTLRSRVHHALKRVRAGLSPELDEALGKEPAHAPRSRR